MLIAHPAAGALRRGAHARAVHALALVAMALSTIGACEDGDASTDGGEAGASRAGSGEGTATGGLARDGEADRDASGDAALGATDPNGTPMEGGTDTDARADASADTGRDGGRDAALDAAIDASTDAGMDAGSSGDAGTGVVCPDAPPPIAFADATTAAGINAPHVKPATGAYFGIGQGWGDVDRDGWPDLLVTGGNAPALLYRNLGTGAFAPLAILPALPTTTLGGVSFADFDNDGWLDAYLANDGPNHLLHNLDGTAFTQIAASAGVTDGALRGQTGSWGDYDGDGWLDLYVANHNLDRDGLYRNRGDGTFDDVSALVPVGPPNRPAFVGTFVDYDNDGDPDLYVVNDHRRNNILWRNDGAGCGGWCFTNVSDASGAGVAANGMGIAVVDYDGDGDLDLYSSDIRRAWLLQNQTAQGSPTFLDVTVAAGVDWLGISWGTVAADFDNDGWPDLMLTTSDDRIGLSDRLFRNRGGGTFDDVSEDSGVSDLLYTLGVATADYDGDGFVDLVIGNQDAGYRLLRNLGTPSACQHWLRIRLVGDTQPDADGQFGVNRDAIGSRVAVELDDGRVRIQELASGSSLGAGNDLSLHFGLGAALPYRVTVRWPDGRTTRYSGVPVDQEWTLTWRPPAPDGDAGTPDPDAGAADAGAPMDAGAADAGASDAGAADAGPANPCCTRSTAGPSGTGCPDDPAIEACVCGQDDHCCTVAWDLLCDQAVPYCGGHCP
jgi:hypothetical protein